MFETIEDVIVRYQHGNADLTGDPMLAPRRRGVEALPAPLVARFGLPGDYCSFVEAYRLEGVALGFVTFGTATDTVETMLERENGPERPPLPPGDWTVVGRAEGDPMLLRRGPLRHGDGRVHVHDISSGSFVTRCASPDFPTFVCLTASMDAVGSALGREGFVAEAGRLFPSLDPAMLGFWAYWHEATGC